MSVGDWVETTGAFSFVRVWNHGNEPIEIGDAQIGNCENVSSGCGDLAKHILVDPSAVATIAVVTAASPHERPSFTYRYTARMAHYAFRGSGGSKKDRPDFVKPMTAHEIAAAQASSIAALRGTSQAMERPATPVVVTTPAVAQAPTLEPAIPPPTVMPAPFATAVSPMPTREPTPIPTLTPHRVRVAHARPTPTPTPTPGWRAHSFQHLITRGMQHWLLHEP